MRWLDKLEKRFRPFAVSGVTVYLIVGQTIVWAASLGNEKVRENVLLIPARVFDGEIWRLVTFIFDPPLTNPIFALFAWYLFYLMGDALETQWGVARYNLFLLIAYLATLAAAFLGHPEAAMTNAYIGGSVFLAFAHLFPDFQIYLFFILPVRIKWLALITWIVYAFRFTMGTWTERWLVLAATGNFLLFFGRDIYLTMRSRRRRMEREVLDAVAQHRTVHQCVVCGVTEQDDPAMEFRYCSKCDDSPCYCGDHIRDHQHRTAAAAE
jgi:hypothetical protein